MVEFHDWRKTSKRRKYHYVVVFETRPHDCPRTSKECMELARFTHGGDAFVYARDKVRDFREHAYSTFHNAWAVVIR